MMDYSGGVCRLAEVNRWKLPERIRVVGTNKACSEVDYWNELAKI